MLDPMEKDAAIEVASTLLAHIFRYEKKFGADEQTAADEKSVLDFKHQIRFDDENMTWDEVLAFSRKWLPKYPAEPVRRVLVSQPVNKK